MPTLLVNSKMNPMLAARIDASVRGKREVVGTLRSTARVVALVRFGALVAVVALAISIVWSHHEQRMAFDGRRAAFAHDWDVKASQLTSNDHAFLTRVHRFLGELAGEFAGDHLPAALQTAGGLSAALSRRSIYVRGPKDAFVSTAGILEASGASGKDSLLLCLLDPPDTSNEKSLLPKARLALAGGTVLHSLAPNVHRLHELELALPYLLPLWKLRIEAAKDVQSLQRLEREFQKAPVNAVREALAAELLIVAVDEANDSGGVTELDGEHAHWVRIAVWDLGTSALLLRLRRHVDPGWVTANRRSQYARELDSCKLALDVHGAVREATGK